MFYPAHIHCVYTEIEEQLINHTTTIKSVFKEIHDSLNQKEQLLVKSLNDMANKKREKLLNESNILKQHRTEATKVM